MMRIPRCRKQHTYEQPPGMSGNSAIPGRTFVPCSRILLRAFLQMRKVCGAYIHGIIHIILPKTDVKATISRPSADVEEAKQMTSHWISICYVHLSRPRRKTRTNTWLMILSVKSQYLAYFCRQSPEFAGSIFTSSCHTKSARATEKGGLSLLIVLMNALYPTVSTITAVGMPTSSQVSVVELHALKCLCSHSSAQLSHRILL